jgi:3-deoxy-manno-octulosonate cytidylyltransferase (CMP-KDO synthetase)
MKTAALIPARYEASRFPGKLMGILGDKPVIRHTYDSTLATGLFDDVYVVTDSDIIYNEITQNGGKAIRSRKEHSTGSDRIAEAAEMIDTDIVVNVQGDEPFVKRATLEKLLKLFDDPKTEVASLVQILEVPELISDPNYVKVALDREGFALYFSRAPIPHDRDNSGNATYYEHIGVYGFRKQALLDFTKLEPTPLEETEKIEPLRFLENGYKIKMAVTDYMGIEIDTPEDLEKANEYLRNNNV